MQTLYNLINILPEMLRVVFHILYIFQFCILSLFARKPIRNDSTCDWARIPNIVFSFEVTEALNIPQNPCRLSNYSFLYISKFNEAFMMSLLPIEKPLFYWLVKSLYFYFFMFDCNIYRLLDNGFSDNNRTINLWRRK